MTRFLFVRNRQRTRRIDTRRLRSLGRTLLETLLAQDRYHLGVYLVDDPEMIRINETFLRHAGSTDVITFTYAEPGGKTGLHGEIFICIDEAIRQARKFRVSWQSELARYLVHGVLHLCGHEDHKPRQRQAMKRAENSLLRLLSQRYPLARLRLPSVQ